MGNICLKKVIGPPLYTNVLKKVNPDPELIGLGKKSAESSFLKKEI